MDWGWKSLKVDVKCSLLDLPQALHPFTSHGEFHSSSRAAFNFLCQIQKSIMSDYHVSTFIILIPNWLAHFFFLYSVDWFNQLGIVTFTRTIFGRPLSTEKCAIDSSYRWTGYVFILTFCLFCQTIRPNIPQVIILIRRKRISFWFCLKLL